MSKYGQYCPIAKSLEILGDRWTLLIIRDLLLGTRHFNELERGLPGISRGLLASRLRLLQQHGIVERRVLDGGRSTVEYRPTEAGRELMRVLGPLRVWGEKWAFGDPAPDQLDPVLLMWWLRQRADRGLLPERRIVVQFDFTGAAVVSLWLLLARSEVAVCLTDPGFEVDILVTADLAGLYRVWGGRMSYALALNSQTISVDGPPNLMRAFPRWFGWAPERQRTAVA